MDVIVRRRTSCDGRRVSVIHLRRLVLAGSLAALAAAILGGLGRLGLMPSPPAFALRHGAAMVGFLAVVVSLERAFLLRDPRAHGVPLVGVAGLFALLGGAPPWLGHLLLVATGVGLVGLQGALLVRRGGVDNVLMTGGAVAWVGGQVAVAQGAPFSRAAPAWATFVVLVIVGERLELHRRDGRLPAPRSTVAGWAALLSHGLAALLALPSPRTGAILLGIAWCVSGVALLATDPGVRGPTRPGLDRYVAVALALGFGWLVAAGFLTAAWPGIEVGPRYDARVHALFGGFGLSLLFAHGPLVLPPLAGREGAAWSRGAWVALAVLQVAVVGRVLGDLGDPSLRAAGTALHAAAVLAFVLAMIRGLVRLTSPHTLRF